jgi:pimeloyl-ACP methyl ester carboxylesterase
VKRGPTDSIGGPLFLSHEDVAGLVRRLDVTDKPTERRVRVMAIPRIPPVYLCSLLMLALGATPGGGAAQVPGPDAFVGVWEGLLDAGAAQLRLVFHVDLGDGGELTGSMDSPDQGANGIPATSVSVDGRSLTFTVATLQATFEGVLSEEGAQIEGTFSQGPANIPLVIARTDAPTELERPQNPEPPFPYRSEPVRFDNERAGVTLAGTLTTPEGDGPFPGAVLVSGSGPQDRDETLMGHRPFLVLSDHLTRNGIAVLRYDDRGVAESSGDFSSATSKDFAGDALAATRFLAARPDVGPVGIVGHSEGGLIGPMAASASDDVAFVVMLAGPGITGVEILELQAALINRAEGAPEEMVERNRQTQRRLFEVVLDEPDPEAAAPRLRATLEAAIADLPEEVRQRMGASADPENIEIQVQQVNSAWFRFFLMYDPRPTLEQLGVPVLALNGEKDLQVPAEENLSEIRAALERGGNPDATVTMLPSLNHLFQEATTGSISEYGRISQTMSPVALEAISSWILERFGSLR